MKKAYTLIYMSLACAAFSIAQTTTAFESHFTPVRNKLVAWDQVRGEWLAQSMVNMAQNKPTPDRNFPEDFTPAEMFAAMPEETQRAVREEITQSSTANNADPNEVNQWNRVQRFASRNPNCRPVMGRSYGDPHLSSFDNATYSFQTVGEFTLAQSESGHMNVQVRQRNQGDNFSLNTATAMWVDGDRVCFYANEKPDGNTTTPLRVDGQAVYIDAGSTYYLEHGGTITKSKNDYVVTWPTGEKVQLDMRQTGGMGFINIAVEIYPCTDRFDGILGNANGDRNDDYTPRGSTSRSTWNTGVFGSNNRTEQAIEKEYLAFMAKDYARSYRITQETSLFDYGFNQSTFTFTDESFPRVHHTLGDLSNDDMNRARRNCERQGFTGAELSACIYDNGFLRIEPTPAPKIPNRTAGRVLRPVSTPTPNVNPGQRPYRERYPEAKKPNMEGIGNTGGAQPLPTNPGRNGVENTTEKPQGDINDPQIIEGIKDDKIGGNTNTQPATRTTNTSENPEIKTPVIKTPAAGSTNSTPPPVNEPAKPKPVIRNTGIFNTGTNNGNGGGNTSTPAKKPASNPVSTPVSTPKKPAPVKTTPAPTPIPSRRGG